MNLPADVDIQQPDVFVKASTDRVLQDVNGAFRGTDAEVRRERVFLGTTDSGAASGTVVAMKIPRWGGAGEHSLSGGVRESRGRARVGRAEREEREGRAQGEEREGRARGREGEGEEGWAEWVL
ncbi:MAG: hypothetical protein U0271_11135 [Polyangiaceae bacterium]